jgi:hypothetical protein
MVGELDNGLKLENFDSQNDNETEIAKVEIGDNYAIVVVEPKNKDAFFMVFCNKPLHKCMETFSEGTLNTKATCFWGDCGISEQQDQMLKTLLTCCLKMLVLLSPILT